MEDSTISIADKLLHELWSDHYDNRMLHGDMTKTPERFAQALKDLTTPEPFEFTMFASDSDEMVVQTGIPFVSLCAHHLLPFRGVAHVAYVPDGQIVGLSKLARAVQHFSAALQVQEELTEQIAEFIYDKLDQPVGVAVIMTGEHMCMTLRGIEAHGTLTTTSKMIGCFADHTKLARQEFMDIIKLAQ